MKAGSEAVWSCLRGMTAHVQVTEDMVLGERGEVVLWGSRGVVI